MIDTLHPDALTRLYGNNGRDYFRVIEAESEADPSWARGVFDLLTKTREPLPRNVLAELQRRSFGPGAAVSRRVQFGRDLLRAFFVAHDHEGFYAKGEHVVLLYGSLQYDDPRSCDADILIVSRRTPSLERYARTRKYRDVDLLIPHWKRVGAEPHISTLALESLNDPIALVRAKPVDVSAISIDISAALSGIPLFAKDTEWHKDFGQDILEAVNSDPFLSAMVTFELQRCLEDRIQREKQRAYLSTLTEQS